MLTAHTLVNMPPDTIFASGTLEDSTNDINIANSGKEMRWVAVRGKGFCDWAIYVHFAIHSIEYVARSGDKIFSPVIIQLLVPCDEDAIRLYRR